MRPPIVWMTHHEPQPMLFFTKAEARGYCEEYEDPIPLYREGDATEWERLREQRDVFMVRVATLQKENRLLRKELRK